MKNLAECDGGTIFRELASSGTSDLLTIAPAGGAGVRQPVGTTEVRFPSIAPSSPAPAPHTLLILLLVLLLLRQAVYRREGG